MIDIGTRRHGPFDPRYSRPRVRANGPTLPLEAERATLDAWEGEGGLVSSLPPASRSRRNGVQEQPACLPESLGWAAFSALAYPGMKRHYFPAIAAWYRYREGDRSRPQTVRQREAVRASAPRAPRSRPRRRVKVG